VDARDIAREETDTDDSYREKLLERGNEKLLEKTETWECVFRPLASDFGRRFDLGDILTVILAEYGLKLKARVARFTQIEQNNQTKTTIEVGAITIVR
jgi:phosphoribosyl-ATP pyrophosphohydrolase